MVNAARALAQAATLALAACCPPSAKGTADGSAPAASAPRPDKEVLAEMKANCRLPNEFVPKREYLKHFGDKQYEKYMEKPDRWECVEEDEFVERVYGKAGRSLLSPNIFDKAPDFAELVRYCRKYDNAKNEIKKSEVYNEYNAYLKKVKEGSFEHVGATIKDIETPRGGGVAMVTFDLGSFEMVQSYKPDDPYWATISELEKGQDVLISATNVRPTTGLTERLHVCSRAYSGTVTKVLAHKKKK